MQLVGIRVTTWSDNIEILYTGDFDAVSAISPINILRNTKSVDGLESAHNLLLIARVWFHDVTRDHHRGVE